MLVLQQKIIYNRTSLLEDVHTDTDSNNESLKNLNDRSYIYHNACGINKIISEQKTSAIKILVGS